jgi:hypothetical protein
MTAALKKHTFLVLLLLLALPAPGQIQLGLKGGYFFYSLTGQGNSESTKYSLSPDSYLISVAAYQRSSSVFNLGLELEYLTRQFDVAFHNYSPGGGVSGNYRFRLDQLNCQIKPQFVFGKKVKFFIYPGFIFGYFLNTEMDGSRSSYSGPSMHDTIVSGSANEIFHSLDFGLMVGAGIEIPVHDRLFIVFENNYSFSIATGSFSSEGNNLFLNMKFEAGIAYTFRSKKEEKP